MQDIRKKRTERSVLRFKVHGHPVVLLDQRLGPQRKQIILVNDSEIGTITTLRGSRAVSYTTNKDQIPRVIYVGAGGKNKETIIRDCRRKIIESARQSRSS